ncbi:MipA/OmpV family protein [Rhizobium sp. LjRoot98]|uniref:MipA/OmpV family protein n=1 Tax=Rhizobium sp. LjRoot98 TaxID=3342345 RepID=UPI003ED1554C
MPHNPIPTCWLQGKLSLALLSVLIMPASGYAESLPVGDGRTTAPIFIPDRFGAVAQKLHGWDTVIGAGVMYRPKYEGSRDMEISPVPFVSATFFDRWTIDPSGIGVKAYERGLFQLDVKFGYDLGRSEDDSDDLRGLGDINAAATIGGKASLNYGSATFFVSADKMIGGSDGLIGKAGIEITQPVTETIILGAGASVTFADRNYMETYFGVDAGQAVRSGYRTYKPGAGAKSIDLSVSATYLINGNWMLRGEQTLGMVTGDAADSPIVRQTLQPSSLLILGYRF